MFGSDAKLIKRVESLESTLAALTRSYQSLELEWINAYGKFRKIAARINHDQAVIDSREQSTAERGDGTDASQAVASPGLSEHQRQIQQAILRRRGGSVQ
jgi:hypothetical protein